MGRGSGQSIGNESHTAGTKEPPTVPVQQPPPSPPPRMINYTRNTDINRLQCRKWSWVGGSLASSSRLLLFSGSPNRYIEPQHSLYIDEGGNKTSEWEERYNFKPDFLFSSFICLFPRLSVDRQEITRIGAVPWSGNVCLVTLWGMGINYQ